MNEQAGCALLLDANGRTWWSSESDLANGSSCLELTFDEAKGRGVVATRKLRKSTLAFHNIALVSVVVNGAETDVCSRCWRALCGKEHASPQWPSQRFCSTTCMELDRDFLLLCGGAIRSIAKQRKEYFDAQVLALKYLYRLSVESSAEEWDSLLAVLGLAHHFSTKSAEDCAAQFFSVIEKEAPQLLTDIRRLIPFDRALGRKLLAIVQLNAQPVRLYGAGNISILCLLPTVARLNHSCQPNCELMTRVDGTWPSVRLTISVLATVTLRPGDELLISYLSVLHESRETRRQLLQQGFQFTCQCQRCKAESGECVKEVADLERWCGARTPPLPLDECEEIVQRCGELRRRYPRAQSLIAPGLCNALLLVIADYPGRFQRYKESDNQYLRFALAFFGAGRMLVDFSAHYCPHGLMRVQLMVAICLYAALAAKRFSARAASFMPPIGLRDTIAQAISTCAEAQETLDKVYLTEENKENLREDDALAGMMDSWLYAQQLRQKLETLRSSLQQARLLFSDT